MNHVVKCSSAFCITIPDAACNAEEGNEKS